MQDNVTQVETSADLLAKGWQHVAYYDEGGFHWVSGIAPRDCELYQPAPAAAHRLASTAQPEVKGLVEALERAAGWFEEYATSHDKKMRETVDSYEQAQRADKAIRNTERAKELRAALAAYREAQP